MGSGGLGKKLKKSFQKAYKFNEQFSLGAQAMNAFDMNPVGAQIYGKDEAKAEAIKQAGADQAKADADALAAKNAAADATNAQSVLAKRRRKASSVLSKAGSGLTESSNSVLSAAATYGKSTLGA